MAMGRVDLLLPNRTAFAARRPTAVDVLGLRVYVEARGRPPIVIETRSYSAPLPQAAPPDAPSKDLHTELLKLDELRAKGLLTDEEFAAQKRKLLS